MTWTWWNAGGVIAVALLAIFVIELLAVLTKNQTISQRVWEWRRTHPKLTWVITVAGLVALAGHLLLDRWR